MGFHVANPAGFGRGAGAGAGAAAEADFSKAAILSRSEPTLGFGGVAGWSDITGDIGRNGRSLEHDSPLSKSETNWGLQSEATMTN